MFIASVFTTAKTWKQPSVYQKRKRKKSKHMPLWKVIKQNTYTELLEIKNKKVEFSLCLSRLRTQHYLHEDVGSIPSLAQWVKDPVLP